MDRGTIHAVFLLVFYGIFSGLGEINDTYGKTIDRDFTVPPKSFPKNIKAQKDAEYGVFWKCIQAGAIYLVTQLCKMLALATFFPASDITNIGRMETITEFLKNTVDVADLIGLHIVMTKFAGKGETKFLVAGLGWASAELLMTRIVPLWVGARSVEFDWKYLQMSFDSNISLVHYITTATLVWLWSRHDLRKTHLPIVVVMLAAGCYRPLISELFITVFGFGAWPFLAVKALCAIIVGLISMHVYFSLTQNLNSY